MFSGVAHTLTTSFSTFAGHSPAPAFTLTTGFNGGRFSWAAISGKLVAAELWGQVHGCNLRPLDRGRFS